MVSMAELLSDDQINDALESRTEWQADGPAIVRTVKLATFGTAIEVVNRVAEIADEMDHHPDIDIRFRTLTFSISTHALGGLTQNDFTLADRIDTIVSQR